MLNPEFNTITMNHSIKNISLFLCCILFIACNKEGKYDGDSMINYPDMELILKENLESYQKAPYTFKLITLENGKKDSSFLKASEVVWKELTAPFLKANLYQKKLDKHYDINVFTDTLYGKMTMLLTSIDPKAITSKMSITAKSGSNKIMTVYAETRDAGFLTTKEYKLLYVVGKTLQIQEATKYPFMDVKKRIRTLSFLN